ncbi:hypothetical protein TIFTF001_012374 [Ficus carica]|uniref:Uncharacterized protein n=1 Tax=Ficus carica TaxID=3494 RepID=A0AA88AFS9_FICCA|nr:hypothetical protein TIFTF001_012374 [Ficus carica]
MGPKACIEASSKTGGLKTSCRLGEGHEFIDSVSNLIRDDNIHRENGITRGSVLKKVGMEGQHSGMEIKFYL